MTEFHGITLERYAELAAVVSDVTDENEQVKLVEAQGVSREAWDGAKAGFTAKMQDMSDMGQTATQYMSLYQAALAKKGPVAQASIEDFVAMSAVLKARGYEGMIATYNITQNQWTQIAGHWNNTIGQALARVDLRYNHVQPQIEQEAQRILAGGEPKPISIGKAAPGVAPAQAPSMQQMTAAAYQPMPAQAAAMGLGGIAQTVGAAMGVGIGVGTPVLVQWSDGNKYPGHVVQLAQGQYQVAMGDGRQLWVGEAYISRK